MTSDEKRQTRAAVSRLRAAESEALAGASSLPMVREKHDLAATRWRELAELDERESTAASLAGRLDRS